MNVGRHIAIATCDVLANAYYLVSPDLAMASYYILVSYAERLTEQCMHTILTSCSEGMHSDSR